MSDRERLERALIAADKAGDTEAAKKLARALRGTAQEQEKPAPVAAAPQPQEPTDNRPTGDAVDAVNESVMSVGTGAVATPIAGLAGLGTAAARGLGLTDAFPGDVVERVQSALTYQPRTKAGSAATGAVSYPFEKLAQGADWVGQQVSDSTGSPALAAA